MQRQLLRASVRRASPTSASFPPTSMPPCGWPLTMPSRLSSPRSMPTPWTYSSIAPPAARRTPTPSYCSIKPDGTARRRSLSRWWWTPIASNWDYIDHTIIITFWITGIAFTAILLFMAYCVFRFRHQEGTRATYNPENKKLEWWLTIVTAVGVGAMLAPGLFVWNQFITVPQGASEVEVIGRQWQWSFRLPGEDGRLGTSETQYV